MSKQAKYNTALDKQVEAWLESKGIKPSEVAADYTIKREDGLTRLTLTFFAADFPLPPAAQAVCDMDCPEYNGAVCACPSPPVSRETPMSCTYHIDCALGRPHPDHTDNPVSRETECPHGYSKGDHHWFGCMGVSPFPDETNLFPSNAINRPHTTCIDTTRAHERPYSSWVCGPDCPKAEDSKFTPECTCPGDLHLKYRFACPLNETAQQ